ncbi:transcriptional regulator, TetR family [Beutenbergia cavernae DSM 12333]|uniref:Transcriptional regulator, TetR family n=1 Tax=Beutenbergia cavernae (strain ATCC BAA-8 / DSM 12333 / CCUG 43141 / JCM 11478 / NBRC 16432 / NCIMB 13614 / HKI 0122) TaxID=471853 RepID=C5BY40_BEUC1|nr:TetR/AcrR family transcriptional regulator [Beutenbergia cavernae]ACQ78934.1 transcriptional regulator, TetR family [Beutenbergia cavernae DSM 12333]
MDTEDRAGREDERPDDAVPSALRVLWGTDRLPRRGPRPSLTVDAIAAAAIGVADDEGLAALSMSRLAKELGVSTMALYRYVSSKDDVLALMADRIAPDAYDLLGPPDDDWRAALERWALVQLDLIQEHPWMFQLTLTTMETGPNRMRWVDWAVGAFRGTRLTAGEKLSLVGLMAAFLLAEGRLVVEEAAAGSAAPDVTATILAHADSAMFPHLAAAFRPDDGDADVAELWTEGFGVRTLLDGIAVIVERADAARGGA